MANRFDSPDLAHDQWLAKVEEPIIEPELPILDAHHHLWIRGDTPYLLREFALDLHSGHNIVATVFEECHSMYRSTGPEAQRSIGEMEFVAGVAAMSDAGAFETRNVCRTAIGNVDLMLGAAVRPLLEGLITASGGRMRGIRASVCWDASDRLHRVVQQPDYLADANVRAAIGVLQDMQLVMDCWLYHPQIPQLTQVASDFPDLKIVLNHTGTPILGGPYRDATDQVRVDWRQSMKDLAKHPNVFVKLGALPALFGRDKTLPPTSKAVADVWSPWIEPAIEIFGAQRCMFESNFPVHKNWMSYAVLWNAFKRMAAGATSAEKHALFMRSAQQVYQIQIDESASQN